MWTLQILTDVLNHKVQTWDDPGQPLLSLLLRAFCFLIRFGVVCTFSDRRSKSNTSAREQASSSQHLHHYAGLAHHAHPTAYASLCVFSLSLCLAVSVFLCLCFFVSVSLSLSLVFSQFSHSSMCAEMAMQMLSAVTTLNFSMENRPTSPAPRFMDIYGYKHNPVAYDVVTGE